MCRARVAGGEEKRQWWQCAAGEVQVQVCSEAGGSVANMAQRRRFVQAEHRSPSQRLAPPIWNIPVILNTNTE